MSEHDGIHIMPMYYRASTHAIPIRAGQTDIGVPIQDIIIQAMGDRDAKLASAGEEIERLRGLVKSIAEENVSRYAFGIDNTEWYVCHRCGAMWEEEGQERHSDNCLIGEIRAALAKNP